MESTSNYSKLGSFAQERRSDVCLEEIDGSVCNGLLRTVYINRSRKWVRIGRMCMRCLTFFPDSEYFSETITNGC